MSDRSSELLASANYIISPTSLAVKSPYPPEDELDGADPAAKWSWANNHPAGGGSDTLPGAHRLFLPLRGPGAASV